MAGDNRLTLEATVSDRGELRYTPAGIPAIELTLMHASVQGEAGGERRVECEMAAVAFGEQALSLSRVPKGATLRCEGFVARRWRTGVTVALHVQRHEITKGN